MPQPSGQGGSELRIGHSDELGARLQTGDSLAVSGVCLTVLAGTAGESRMELAPETLARTTLGGLGEGDAVNLEPALRVGDALGGHWVQGHVDGTAAVVAVSELDEHRYVELELMPELERYVVEKGSIAVDGVSLTVARRGPDSFHVALIPHTLEVTTLGGLAVGDRVNLEVDIMAKYVERMVLAVLPDRR